MLRRHLTYKAVIGYLYTGSITFAPLASGGCVREPRHFGPAPSQTAVSPKSVYRLADSKSARISYTTLPADMTAEIVLPLLQNLARHQIMASIDATNVLAEVCSPFSALFNDVSPDTKAQSRTPGLLVADSQTVT